MTTLDLSGLWQIRHDPYNAGLLWGWPSRPPEDGWQEIAVPSAWQSVLGMDANGVAWYRRELPREVLGWARDQRARVRLRFESVATDCRVWVNSVEVGRHVGDFVPFEFDITDAVRSPTAAAPIPLIVRVDQIHAPRPAKGTVTENGHITKGFHDVLSVQHAGIWCGVSVRRTGVNAAVPNGVSVRADAATARVRAELLPTTVAPIVPCTIYSAAGRQIGGGVFEGKAGDRVAELDIRIEEPVAPWSPDSPSQYTLVLDVDGATGGPNRPVDSHTLRFGFRTVETGGPDNRRILLNGSPLLLRGVLHWGHEPRYLAPAPPPEQVREEFTRLRALGFNCVCLCMVYMPEYFYDIADDTGMLIWQEHPVWKSRTEPEFHAEYYRLFDAFMRRDARHPSVILVSGSCEHEALNADLSAWWWTRAKEVLPDRLLQSQTAFTSWTNPQETDLHDEHVYDNTGRWTKFLGDVRTRLAELPAKPFVMGETIIASHWPQAAPPGPPPAPTSSSDRSRLLSRGTKECAEFEAQLASRYGHETLARFRHRAERWALDARKIQVELFRADAANAGWVMNHIRDVPACRCGFKDDHERWRFDPAQTLPWLGDTAILLRTPEDLRGHAAGSPLALELGLSNFGSIDFASELRLRTGTHAGLREVGRLPLTVPRGEVGFAGAILDVPAVDGPRRLRLEADGHGLHANTWDLWILPAAAAPPRNASRLGGMEFTPVEREPEFEEKAYSSGWGLTCRTWKPSLPDTTSLAPALPAIAPDATVPRGTSVVLTHRLTLHILEFIRAGGRALLLASRHAGSIPSRFINLYGGVPLVIEQDGPGFPFAPGDGDWVCDLLSHDLTRDSARAIASDELGIADAIEPLVRFLQTHDSGVPKPMEMVFASRIGEGVLVVSTLDHTTVAGRFVLRCLLHHAAHGEPPRCELDIARWTLPG